MAGWSHGRITTVNAALHAAMLQSPRSTETSQSRKSHLYADGGTFSKDDEEKYKFVSPNVDEFDDVQDHAINAGLSTRNTNSGDIHVSRTSQRSSKTLPSKRGRESTHSSTSTLQPQSQLTAEEERELEELRREDQYQSDLRAKIEQEEQAEQGSTFIPRLNLDESDDEEKRINKLYKDSLDIDLRDSLDGYSSSRLPSQQNPGANWQPLKGDAEAGVAVSGVYKHDPPTEAPTDDERLRALMGDEPATHPTAHHIHLQPGPVSHGTMESDDPRLKSIFASHRSTDTSVVSAGQYNITHPPPPPPPPPPNKQTSNVPPSDYTSWQSSNDGHDVYMVQNEGEHYAEQHTGKNMHMTRGSYSQHPVARDFHPVPIDYEQAMVAGGGWHAAFTQQPDQQHTPMGPVNSGPLAGPPLVLHQYGDEEYVHYASPQQHYYQPPTIEQQTYEAAHTSLAPTRQTEREHKPADDIIRRNKERLQKPPSGKRYGGIHAAKKANKENISAPPQRRKKHASGETEKLGNLSAPHIPATQEDDPNMMDPEAVWQRRAMTLAQKKSAGGKQTGGKQKAMKKYSSDSQVNHAGNDRTLGNVQYSSEEHLHYPGQPPASQFAHGFSKPKHTQNYAAAVLTPEYQRLSADWSAGHTPQEGYSSQRLPGPLPYHHPRPGMPPTHSPAYTGAGYPGPTVGIPYSAMTGQPGPQASFRPSPGPDGFRRAPDKPPVSYHPMTQALYQNKQPAYEDDSYMEYGYPAHELRGEGNLAAVTVSPGRQAGHVTSPGRQEKPQTPGSPYKVLPPIGSADTDKGRFDGGIVSPRHHPGIKSTSPRRDEGGSYMDAFKKQKSKQNNYNAYTLKDYKHINKEVKLAGLGPDLDSETLKERREKALRQQEYARQIQARNKQTVKPGKPKPSTEPAQPDHDTAENTKRKLAIEYAKNVPKPKPRPPLERTTPTKVNASPSHTAQHRYTPLLTTQQTLPSQTGSACSVAGRTTYRSDNPSFPVQQPTTTDIVSACSSAGRPVADTADVVDMSALEELQLRHQREREQADRIRQNIQGVS